MNKVPVGALVVLTALIAGCSDIYTPSSAVLRPAHPSHLTFDVAAPRDRVFDAALVVAQNMNLNVAVIEKASGLLRLERARIAPADLDAWCDFFEVVDTTGEPVSTFASSDIAGTVSMTILLTQASATLTGVDMRLNWMSQPVPVFPPMAYSGYGPVDLQSKEVLEKAFKDALLHQLGIAT